VLNDGGILVSVMSPSLLWRTNKKTWDFRNWLDELEAQVFEMEEGAFKASGTSIRTNVVKIAKN
jgi:hypothetical protein